MAVQREGDNLLSDSTSSVFYSRSSPLSSHRGQRTAHAGRACRRAEGAAGVWRWECMAFVPARLQWQTQLFSERRKKKKKESPMKRLKRNAWSTLRGFSTFCILLRNRVKIVLPEPTCSSSSRCHWRLQALKLWECAHTEPAAQIPSLHVSLLIKLFATADLWKPRDCNQCPGRWKKILSVRKDLWGQLAPLATQPCRKSAPSASFSPSSWSCGEKQLEKAASEGTDSPNAASC